MMIQRNLTIMGILAITSGLACILVKADDKGAYTAKPTEGYSLTLKSVKNEFRPNEEIEVALVMKNVGETVVSPGGSSFLMGSDFKIELSTGEPIPLTLYGKRWLHPLMQGRRQGSDYLFSLKPNEETSSTFSHFNRLYDMTLSGTYKMTASIQMPKRDGTKDTVTVSSNTIEIVVDDNAKVNKMTSGHSENSAKD